MHQVLAILSGKKTKTQNAVTALYQEAQKPGRFEGFAKEYGPAEANRIFGGGSEGGSAGAIPNDRNVAGASDALLNSGKY